MTELLILLICWGIALALTGYWLFVLLPGR